MVGLCVVLENQNNGNMIGKKSPQLINKTTMFSSSQLNHPSSLSSFLEHCFLCKQKLLPGKDIYMYKGDRGFCSVKCRCRQIFMDEEENLNKGNCCLASRKMKPSTSSNQ